MVSALADDPQGSLPRRCRVWSATMGAYRLLNHPRVEPAALIRGHVQQTRGACEGEPVVLCVQDGTELEAVRSLSPTKLVQHSALAVRPDGRVLGMLAGLWEHDPAKPPGETRAQRALRRRRSSRWTDTVQAVGEAPWGCRLIHVADREADDFRFYESCLERGHGFVVRSQHNRYVQGDADRLWPWMQRQTPGGCVRVWVPRRQAKPDGPPRRWREAQSARQAHLQVSWGRVQLQPPRNDPHGTQPLSVHGVRAWEVDPPAGAKDAPGGDPLQWTLITSEAVTNLQEALLIVEHYRQRWRIEEWHRAMKTGCRLEASQLHDANAFFRLAALCAVVGVRLLQLRDLDADDQPDNPTRLREIVPDPRVRQIAAKLAAIPDPDTLTPRQFLRIIAQLGGWLARKHDGRPGWQTLWHGWRKIHDYAQGSRLINPP